MFKRILGAIACFLVIIIGIGFCGFSFYTEHTVRNLEENASCIGTVVEKECNKSRGYYFHVFTEHKTTDLDGNKTVLLKEYYVSPDVHYDIDIGDAITADKNSYRWELISYDSVTEKR